MLLTERRFDALTFRGPGTDLTIGLLPQASWHGAEDVTTSGIRFVPNLPTEEIYTTPDCRRTEGRVRATRPVMLHTGAIVHDLELHFERGEITEVRATAEIEAVEAQLAADAGARRLGEVALVDRASRVGQLGIVFYHGLFDENAAPHIAYGAGYLSPVEGAAGLERRGAAGHGSEPIADPHGPDDRGRRRRGGRDRGAGRSRPGPAGRGMAASLTA